MKRLKNLILSQYPICMGGGVLLVIFSILFILLAHNAIAEFGWGGVSGGGGGSSSGSSACFGHDAYYPHTACPEYWIYMSRDSSVGDYGIWGKIGGTYHLGSLNMTSVALQDFKDMLDTKCSFADGYFIFNLSSYIGRGADPEAKLAIHGRTTGLGTFLEASDSAALASFDPYGEYVLVHNTLYRDSSVKAAFTKAALENGVDSSKINDYFDDAAWFCWSESTSEPTSITPSVSVDPLYAEPGEGEYVTFTHRILVDGDGSLDAVYFIERFLNDTPDGDQPKYSGGVRVNGGVLDAPSTPIPRGDGRLPILSDALIGSKYCEKLSLYKSYDPVNGYTGFIDSDEACATVIARPYAKFYGADVGFCSGSGNIYAWAKETGGSYIGSSSQYAVFAYNAIAGPSDDNKQGFYSGESESTAATNPKQLTFANTGDEIFGGNWGDPTGCIDYFAKEGGDVASGDKTIAGDSITPGINKTVYVNGDAYITSDIMYGLGWTKSNIPSYRLIASGNIYIAPNVAQLDGFYSAGKNIYTCSTGPDYNPVNDADYYTHCNKKLTVYGAFQALGSIKYWRTNGTLNLATPVEAYDSSNIAESFIFTPEMLLSKWIDTTTTSSWDGAVQSIRSLPPIF